MMRKLLLFFVMLCVSIGAWADDGNDADGYWLSFDSWSGKEVVTKINVSKPGGLVKAIAAINNDTYTSTKTVGSVTATYKTAKVVYIDTPVAYLNSDDLAALSSLDYETIDLQDAFYKESAEGEKKAFTFTNSSAKYVILPDGWTKAEVNACGQAIAASNTSFGSTYSQNVKGMTETKDVTHYYYKLSDYIEGESSDEVEYTGQRYNNDTQGSVQYQYSVVPEVADGYPKKAYKNTYNNNEVVYLTEDQISSLGSKTSITVSSVAVKLEVVLYSDEACTQNAWWGNWDGTRWHQNGTTVYPKYKYNNEEYTGEITHNGNDAYGTLTGDFTFPVEEYYMYSYTDANSNVIVVNNQNPVQLTKNITVNLSSTVVEDEEITIGASLIAYVHTPNTLYDAMRHCFIDGKGNQKIGNISQYGFSCDKVKALTVSGNAVARDWSGAYSLAFTDGHMIFDVAADELGGAADKGVGGVTRQLTGTTSSQGAIYGASVIYLDLSSVKIDDQYCDDLNLTKATILTDRHNVEVWIPAEGSGLKTIPADFGTNQIVEMCIPSNIETIRTRAFPSVKHIWTTAGTGSGKESWEDEYTKYDNGAVTETLADGTVSPTHTSSATSVVEHTGFKANQGDVTYGTYTFGSNLKLIESNAFPNSEPNVKDVYVLNTTAPECHVDAFNTAMYYGNNGYNATLISSEGIVTRDAYENHGRWITMLHYPKQTKAPDLQRYTDPTRKYSVATGDKDGNGATIYYPNHSEFGYAYAQGTTGYVWNAWDNSRTGSANAMNLTGHVTTGWNTTVQTTSNNNYANAQELENENWEYSAFYDVSVNGTNPNPAPTTYSSVYWSESAYKLAGSQVDASYVQLYDKDYRGWHQFVLNGYSANTTQEVVFERSYIKDSDWWTICLPYDLTYSEMIKFFGTETQLPILSRLLYVTRDIEKEKITLNFSKNLMLYKDNMTLTADGIEDVSSESESVAPNDVVLHAGVPYVIKPYIPTSGDSELATRRFAIYKDTESGLYEKLQAAAALGGDELISLVEDGLYTVPALVVNNTGANAEAVEAGKTVTIGSTTYQVSSVYKYTMVGSLFNNLLPSYCYYLGWKWDNAAKTQGHACFWYNKKTGEDNQQWAWTNNTCIICPNWPDNLAVHKATSTADPARWIVGGDDNTVDDDSYVASTSSQNARSNDILPEAETPVSSSATGISEIKNEEAVSGQNKIYDIDGRFVGNGTSGLTKGVYIVNGKKIIK